MRSDDELPGAPRYGRSAWTGPRDGHLIVNVRGHSERLRISEEGLPSRASWEKQLPYAGPWSDRRRPARKPLGDYEAKATGRLCIEIVSGYGRTRRWADRKSRPLEEKLPEVLLELEVRAAEAEKAEREAERRAEERKRAWEHAIEDATQRYLEDRRGEVLSDEASAWRQAALIRDYCDALARVGTSEASAWAEWGRRYADSIDPLQREVRMPSDPESVPPEALKPYLGGLSPYRPDRW